MKKIILFTFLLFISASCTSLKKPAEAVRGLWLTNVDSDVLNSKQNISDAVRLCSEIGINTIFIVTWNKAMTTYPSKIMKELTGVEIDTLFTGRDPLKELIEEAHKKDIKVIAWFEFGFSSSYNENGGIILKNKPEWAAVDNKGDLVKKNGFEWMNGFHPEVQEFILSLIMEVVENYNIDGIQGDDRLPAMPVEAGYDEYTTELYKKDHHGSNPPAYFKDYEWVRWRVALMNEYMERIYKTVKAFNPEIIISMAPSIYPWSVEEYLQDWPAWVSKGLVEIIIPQVYRHNIDSYKKELNSIIKNQILPNDIDKFYPGILLKVGDYYPSIEFLNQMIKTNRENGFNGEVFFFYEGIKKYPEYFQSLYQDKVIFPKIKE